MLGDRKTYIGGSDVAIIQGVSPFKSRQDLLLEKLGLKEPFRGNAATAYGSEMEAAMAVQYAFDYGEDVTDSQLELKGEVDGFPLIGHIDGKVGDVIIDFKTTTVEKYHDWDSGVPDYYYPQALFYMQLSGTKEFVFYVGFVQKRDATGEMMPKELWRIEERKRVVCTYDEAKAEQMISDIKAFIKDMREGNTGLSNGSEMELSKQVELRDALLQIKLLESRVSDIRAYLLEEMENRGIKKIDNDYFSITYKPGSERKGSIDTAKMQKDGIEIEPYRKAASVVKPSVLIRLK